jgi:pyrophosphate--fructose-6-phosphate 1-phosphotransferase
MNQLVERLIETEDHSSMFESEIRKIAVPVSPIFLHNGHIMPAAFRKTTQVVGSADTENVIKEFPGSFKQTENKILEGFNSTACAAGKRVAVLFSGGPSAGGHNVIAGLKKVLGLNNTLLGVKNGPKGLIDGTLFEIKDSDIPGIINTGGFDFLGTDRTKINTREQYESVKKTAIDNKLNGIIIVGGDDSNTNAAFLAEILMDQGVQVIGVPKTIDGDLQIGDILPISFGFDTATKIYSEMVGNILQDTPSSHKYWHFIKLMGRSASHVALEVALQTKPAVTLISEEVEAKKMSLSDIVNQICDVIAIRAAKGINHGVVIVPEGLIEFIPEMKSLIAELNEILGKFSEDMQKIFDFDERSDFIYKKLSAESAKLMASLPEEIEKMLLVERDSHGNLQVSQIPTERLLIQMVEEKLKEMKRHPDEVKHLPITQAEYKIFSESKFSTNSHFFGYEGRCGAPTLFDAAYTFNLGLAAGSLILDGRTGYIASVTNLDSGGRVIALPLAGLLAIERRHGKNEFVIKKGLVEVDSPAFHYFEDRKPVWAEKDHFSSPGPRQMWGPVCKQLPATVALNRGYTTIRFNLGEDTEVT